MRRSRQGAPAGGRALRFDAGQRFTCQRCGRCCRGWDVMLTAGEVAAYRRADVARLWSADLPGGPFAPVPGHPGLWRLGKRGDGSCGFLSPAGLCRIHEELGAAKKPLACRMFPFRLHPSQGAPLLTTSFSCPTVIANAGATLDSQLEDLSAMTRSWQEAWPEAPRPLQWVQGHGIEGATVGTIRTWLLRLLETPSEDGSPDLRASVARIADRLEDWTRYRVLKLEPAAFDEYLELTGRHAASSPRPPPRRAPSRVGRWLGRGFLLAVVAARVQARGPRRGLRLGSRWRLIRVALHLHGLWPPTQGVNLAAAHGARLDLGERSLHDLVHHYLRSSLETLPTGRRPVLDEIALAFATLNAGVALAAMRATAEGREPITAGDLAAGIAEAADLAHAEGGLLDSMLRTLAGGVDALHAFASGRPL